MVENLSYESIVFDIKNRKLKNIYLFFGPEVYLINDVLSKIKKEIVSLGLESLNYIKLEGQSINYETVVNACETLPLIDNRRIVVVNDVDYFKIKKIEKEGIEDESNLNKLIDYFGKIPETTILILLAGEQVDKRKKIYNCIKKNGDIVEFKQLRSQDIIKWISNILELYGKTINIDDANHLVERAQGSLDDIMNEIKKLCSYVGEKENINSVDIDAVVPKSLEINIFQLVDSVSAKDTVSALLTLNELLLDSEPIPVILTMLIRQYRLLLSTKLLVEKGYTAQEIMSKLSLKSFVFSKMLQVSKKYNETQIQHRLKRCLDVDAEIKMGRMEPRLALETLIVEFAW